MGVNNWKTLQEWSQKISELCVTPVGKYRQTIEMLNKSTLACELDKDNVKSILEPWNTRSVCVDRKHIFPYFLDMCSMQN